MIVTISDEQNVLRLNPKGVESLVRAVIAYEKTTCDEVTIYFVDTPTICELHERFFNDPTPTDCITFPLDQEEDEDFPYRILGEVFVCPETALKYAEKNQVDPLEETSLYIIHGLLHLMGYDDIEPDDILEMRQAEQRHLENIRKLELLLT